MATRSCVEDPGDGGVDLGTKGGSLIAEACELFVEAFDPVVEVPLVLLCGGGSGVAARVEAPALCLDLGPGCDTAEAGDVDVGAIWKLLLQRSLAAIDGLDVLAPVEPDDVCE